MDVSSPEAVSPFYDWDGSPLTTEQWAEKFELGKNHVANDLVGESRISTVWLGLDHSFFDGPPLIFETMVFGGKHDMFQKRYCTEEQAKEGHARVVAMCRET